MQTWGQTAKVQLELLSGLWGKLSHQFCFSVFMWMYIWMCVLVCFLYSLVYWYFTRNQHTTYKHTNGRTHKQFQILLFKLCHHFQRKWKIKSKKGIGNVALRIVTWLICVWLSIEIYVQLKFCRCHSQSALRLLLSYLSSNKCVCLPFPFYRHEIVLYFIDHCF